MTLRVCDECTTKYAPDAPRCPHCGHTESHEEGQMPKITVHGGPSDATLNPPTPDDPGTELHEDPDSGVPVEVTQDTVNAAEPDAGTADADEATASDAPDDAEQSDGDDTEADPAGDTAAADDEDAPERPATSASKADWLAYAQAVHPDEDLSGYTKAELVELYGGQG